MQNVGKSGPDYLEDQITWFAAQTGPDYLGAAKRGGQITWSVFLVFFGCSRPNLLAPSRRRRGYSRSRPRRLASLPSSRELAPRGRAEAPCSAAWRASTARAAGGRAVCVAPLRASVWPCAERVGGALTRAPRARTGTQRRAADARALPSAGCSHPRAHNTLCQAVQRRWQRTPDPISFPCRRLAGSAASCDPHSSHCPGSAAPLLVDRPAARHGSTRWSRGDVRSRGSVGTARGSVGELCLWTTSGRSSCVGFVLWCVRRVNTSTTRPGLELATH